MHLSRLEEVTKLARELLQVETDLANAKDASALRLEFKYPYPSTGWWYATPSGGCNASADGDTGRLARELQHVALRHYEQRRDALWSRLVQLGVEID